MLIEFFDVDGHYHLGQIESQDDKEMIVVSLLPVHCPAVKNVEVGEIAVKYRIPKKDGRPQKDRKATYIPELPAPFEPKFFGPRR